LASFSIHAITPFMSGLIEKDVLVIGAGPSGLFAVFECGMLGFSCAVFDTLEEIGGQCTALYPEKPIYDIPGFPAILAGELIENLERQSAPFKPDYFMGQSIVSISKESGLWHIKTSKGLHACGKAIVIAAGSGAFGPNRPPLADIEKYEGKDVLYMVRRKEDFRGQHIAIAGGGDSALDWTLSLAAIAEKIYLIHRREKFRAAPESVRKLEALTVSGKVDLVVPYQLKALIGQERLKGVEVISEKGDFKMLPVTKLLAFFGLSASLGPLTEWGLNLDQHRIQVDPGTCETNKKGIYAIGDIATYRNKMKLILTGFHEAALAAHAIRAQLNPGQEFHFEYSTTKGLPQKE
jgi:thioredoxin reductase (NADPH)